MAGEFHVLRDVISGDDHFLCCPGGMIDTGKYRHVLCLHRCLEPVHRIFRPVAARYGGQPAIARCMAVRLRSGWNISKLAGASAKELLALSPSWNSEDIMLFAADATILDKCPH